MKCPQVIAISVAKRQRAGLEDIFKWIELNKIKLYQTSAQESKYSEGVPHVISMTAAKSGFTG